MTSFLLKIDPQNIDASSNVASVSKRQSVKHLSSDSCGKIIYIWHTDFNGNSSHLAGKTTIENVQEAEASYNVQLNADLIQPTRSITTDDLETFRDEPEASPMYQLGRLHNNRVQRIIELNDEAASILEARFG